MKILFTFIIIICFFQNSFGQNAQSILIKEVLTKIPNKKVDSFFVNLSYSDKEYEKLPTVEISFVDTIPTPKKFYSKRIINKNYSTAIVLTNEGKYSPLYYLVVINTKTNRICSDWVIASSFIDAGMAEIKTTKFLSSTRFVVYDKDFGERPSNIPCDCTKTHYSILPNGGIQKGKSRKFKIKCE